MFWSGNFIAVRELKFLLKEENVTLTQVLEADDILQECKADNKALIQFLTRPDILAELISHVTEEPPKNVELALQYRYANTASEVIASNISTLRDRLSIDVVQMNRLCDFVNTDKTLNPLLSSFYSKTIEILLQRNPKQDGYLHHIVSLRVLDFFKSRRDFLPNLLRHISTSAICDIFKIFLSLMDPFNKIIIEWFDEHQFLESMIQIICGTYGDPPPEPASITAAPAPTDPASSDPAPSDVAHSTSGTSSSTAELTENVDKDSVENEEKKREEKEAAEKEERDRRWRRRFAARNAAQLLCDVAADACCGDGAACGCGARALQARLRGEDAVRRLLQAVFTAPPAARRHALEHACELLLALLATEPEAGASSDTEELERAVAPHLPLLHHALLRSEQPDPADYDLPILSKGVGNERLAVSALLARLACSEVDDVPNALITLGTPGVLLDMFFAYPNNNFLHKNVRVLIRNARANRRFGDRYTAYLIEECNLLTRFMDAFEANENLTPRQMRAGYMGHLIEALRDLDQNPPPLEHNMQFRWDVFREMRLRIVLAEHDTPLGGVYPSENTYEMTDAVGEPIPAGYDFLAAAEAATDPEAAAETAASMHLLNESREHAIKVGEPSFDENMWDDVPEEEPASRPDSWPWEGGVVKDAAGDDGGWAQFDDFEQSDAFGQGDPFANTESFWPSSGDETSEMASLQRGMQQCGFEEDKDALTILLASKMLTAFFNMPPDQPLMQDTAGTGGQASAVASDTQTAGTSSDTQAPTPTSGTPAPSTTSETPATSTTSDTQAPSTTSEAPAPSTTSDTQVPGTASETQAPDTTSGTQASGKTSAAQASPQTSVVQVTGTASDTQDAGTSSNKLDTHMAGDTQDSTDTSNKRDTTADVSQPCSANGVNTSDTSTSDDGSNATEDTSITDS